MAQRFSKGTIKMLSVGRSLRGVLVLGALLVVGFTALGRIGMAQDVPASQNDLNLAPADAEAVVQREAKAGTRRITGRAGFFERIQPRPVDMPQQLAERTKQLRDAYERAPAEWPAPTVDPEVSWKELGLLPTVVHPEGNAFSAAKAKLGQQLFFDPRLSRSGQMACASCHDPDLGWTDGRTVSFGLDRQELKRNAPSIMNVGLMTHFFWDGRAHSLEDQAEKVLTNAQEMDCSEDLIREHVSASQGYQEQFAAVFGDDKITIPRIAQALACFERAIVGGRSSFDGFLKGKHEALSDSAVRGLDVFRTSGRCMNCHNGPLLSDGRFHDIGLSYYGRKLEDLGRYGVTNETRDAGGFRTPSLRNISHTRPYMHNGLFELAAVLRMYNSGMPTLVPKEDQKGDARFPTKSPHLRPLGLNTQDLEDLEAFLESLTEPRLRHRPPTLPSTSASASTKSPSRNSEDSTESPD